MPDRRGENAELDEFIAPSRARKASSRAPRLSAPIAGSWSGLGPRTPVRCRSGNWVPTPSTPDYLRLLAEGLDLVDATKDIGKALHDQAKRALDGGGTVPGYALSAGRAVRSWRDEATAAPDLLKLGLARDDVLVETLRSPKQVETRAKARGVKVPNELIVRILRRRWCDETRAPVPGRASVRLPGADALLEGGNHDQD
jgi:hypothetical protein